MRPASAEAGEAPGDQTRPKPTRPRTDKQLAALDAGRRLGQQATRAKAKQKAKAAADGEEQILAGIMAGLPPGECTSQERTLARLAAREQVHSDRLSAWLEFNRQHSREVGRKLELVLKSSRLLTELHTALERASQTRVNAAKAGRDGQIVMPPRGPERARQLMLVLAKQGALSGSPDARLLAKDLAEQLEREDREREAIAHEFDGLPVTCEKRHA